MARVHGEERNARFWAVEWWLRYWLATRTNLRSKGRSGAASAAGGEVVRARWSTPHGDCSGRMLVRAGTQVWDLPLTGWGFR